MDGKICAISPEGDTILISLHDGAVPPREIALSFDDARSRALTLPRMLTIALGRQTGDPKMWHVQRAQGFRVECASDQRHLLLTLSCGEDREMVFALDVAVIAALVREPSGGVARLETPRSSLTN